MFNIYITILKNHRVYLNVKAYNERGCPVASTKVTGIIDEDHIGSDLGSAAKVPPLSKRNLPPQTSSGDQRKKHIKFGVVLQSPSTGRILSYSGSWNRCRSSHKLFGKDVSRTQTCPGSHV